MVQQRVLRCDPGRRGVRGKEVQIDRIWEEEEGKEEGSDPLVKVWESAAQPLSSAAAIASAVQLNGVQYWLGNMCGWLAGSVTIIQSTEISCAALRGFNAHIAAIPWLEQIIE